MASSRAPTGVGGDPDVEGLALLDRRVERTEALLEGGVGVEAMVVEDVDVVDAHPAKALVQARQEVLAGAEVAVRARPHVPTGLGRDDQLVAVVTEIGVEDPTEVGLGAAVRRPVVVGQVEVGDAQVESAAQDGALALERLVVAEVLPEPERDGRQQQAAASAAAVGHGVVAVVGRKMMLHDGSSPVSVWRRLASAARFSGSKR